MVGLDADVADCKAFLDRKSGAVAGRVAFQKLSSKTAQLAAPTFLGCREQTRDAGLGRVGTWGSYVLWLGHDSVMKDRAVPTV